MGFQRYPAAVFFVYGNCKVACAVAVADVDCRVNLMPGERKTIADFMVGGFKYDLFSWYNIYRMMIWNKKHVFFQSISQIIHFQSASCQKQMATTCQVWDWMRFFKNSLAVGDSDYWSFSAQSGTKSGNTKNNPVVSRKNTGSFVPQVPIGSMVLLYMVTFTINIPQMLAYIIYHTWILWGISWSQLWIPWIQPLEMIPFWENCIGWCSGSRRCSERFFLCSGFLFWGGSSGVGNCPMTWDYWTSPEKVAI